MPAAIQNLLQKPVQKAIPKPAEAAPANRDSFDRALQDARKSKAEGRVQPVKADKAAAAAAACASSGS
jgi:hypothetical protein